MMKVLAAAIVVTGAIAVIAQSVSVEVSVSVDGTRQQRLSVDAARVGLALAGMLVALKAVIL